MPNGLTGCLRHIVPALFLALLGNAMPEIARAATTGDTQPRVFHAEVVAFDQPMMINRLGTTRPESMMYALRGDVVAIDPTRDIGPGNVQLRPGKRPRPLVLRVDLHDRLRIDFWNWLTPTIASPEQPVTRAASIHVTGLEPVTDITDDGYDAGANPDGQVPPGGHRTYTLYADAEGTFLLYSPAGDFNGFNQTQQMLGLFGAVTVEPAGAEWYRSQITHADYLASAKGDTIDYDARYRDGPAKGSPVLRMTDGVEIIDSDLTALITGPNHGRFAKGSRPTMNPTLLPDREAPFREVTALYSESQDLIQAFPDYSVTDTNLAIGGGGDGFAINYGSSGIVNEILANRLQIGPSAKCPECKFEEFFLSSWPNGDPGLVVDAPANVNCVEGWLTSIQVPPAAPGSIATTKCSVADLPPIKPTKAFYADDPSNVYHAYLGDHVTFRVIHAGVSVHHVHHHHAHQWLFSPDAPGSNYLDSQSIGPGSSFSMELVYGGAGNQNLTAGDSIFHCHFYPHFASGMWALFRVHDVLETGTELDADGRAKPGARALPDPEIAGGTPIPAVVPLPSYAEAPVPAAVEIVGGQVHFAKAPTTSPGYPFFVPGVSGHRPPHPPMAFAQDAGDTLDGGLPRHLVLGGHVAVEVHSLTDYTKDLDRIDAVQLPEDGTAVEKLAMAAHALRDHPSRTPEGKPAVFKETGAPPRSGAPFANPIPQDIGPVPVRRYRGADIQLDAVFNKAGWHYPQQRLMALWDDIKPMVDGTKPPEPLFVRANNGEVVEYWQTNLIPSYFELDDFEVRTPTDIIGQHIHLVKFDVLAADGAANGFNYEDGTFAAEEVRDRIAAINVDGGLCQQPQAAGALPACPVGSKRKILTPKPIKALGNGPTPDSQDWVGAQATVRLWYVDPLTDLSRERSYMTVFTHDHFSPSTHQEAGLYGGVLIEPKGSAWTRPDGAPLGQGRDDGGPTSYAATILPPNGPEGSYREFGLEWADTQFAYGPASVDQPTCYPGQQPPGCTPTKDGYAGYTGWTDTANAINPNIGTSGSPQTQVIGDFGAGTFSMNYRSEPLPLRLANAAGTGPAAGQAGDSSWAYASIPGRTAPFATQPAPGGKINPACTDAACFTFPKQPISSGMEAADPYTPLLQAYPGDAVQFRLLAGGFTTMHDVMTHGLPWKFEPYNPNSGWRESQLQLLSEHFELLVKVPRAGDYLYSTSASLEGNSNGLWGLLRTYAELRPELKPLPDNPAPPCPDCLAAPAGQPSKAPAPAELAFTLPQLSTDCTKGQPCLRQFAVTALTIQELTGPTQSLVYNGRGLTLVGGGFAANEQLTDPLAIVYVRDSDLCAPGGTDCVPGGRLKQGVTVEPLALRAAAGDVIELKLTNGMTGQEPVFNTPINAFRIPYTAPFANINLEPSTSIGLHPQLLAIDVKTEDGTNVGANPDSTVPPGGNRTYRWYAGSVTAGPKGDPVATPIEFGAINLQPSDPLNHAYRGLFGGLVIEPVGSSWTEDPGDASSATVFTADGGSFRDFVVNGQDDVNILLNGFSNYTVGNALSAVNYRTEPAIYRYGQELNGVLGPLPSDSSLPPATPACPVPPSATVNWSALCPADLARLGGIAWSAFDTRRYLSNSLVGGDPQTPIFVASAGMPVRFRLLHAGGNGDNQQVFELTGHAWQSLPYMKDSAVIGGNPASPYQGVQSGYGVTSHYDVVIPAAGGVGQVAGDYVYRTWTADQFQVGFWGLFRVQQPGKPAAGEFGDTVRVTGLTSAADGKSVTITGIVSVRPARNPADRAYAQTLKLTADGQDSTVPVGPDGRWSLTLALPPAAVDVVSPNGGTAHWRRPQELLAANVVAAPSPHPPTRRAVVQNRRHVGLDLK